MRAYFKARSYLPGIGAFAQADTWEGELEHPLTLNAYAYTLGNPLNYTDPSGHETLPATQDGTVSGFIPNECDHGDCVDGGNIDIAVSAEEQQKQDELSDGMKEFFITSGLKQAYDEATGNVYNCCDPINENRTGLDAAKNSIFIMGMQAVGGKALSWVGRQVISRAPGILKSLGTIATRLFRSQAGTLGSDGASLVVNQKTVQAALEGSEMLTLQENVSLPRVERYVRMLENGSNAPPIGVDGKIIVEGNHRYIAGRIFGTEPATVPATAPLSAAPYAKPVQELFLDPTDY